MFRRRFTLTIPTVTNDGQPSDAADAARRGLILQDLTGWTESDGRGYWEGQAEPVAVFHIDARPWHVWRVSAVARHLAQAYGQAAVYVTAEPIRVRMVRADYPATGLALALALVAALAVPLAGALALEVWQCFH